MRSQLIKLLHLTHESKNPSEYVEQLCTYASEQDFWETIFDIVNTDSETNQKAAIFFIKYLTTNEKMQIFPDTNDPIYGKIIHSIIHSNKEILPSLSHLLTSILTINIPIEEVENIIPQIQELFSSNDISSARAGSFLARGIASKIVKARLSQTEFAASFTNAMIELITNVIPQYECTELWSLGIHTMARLLKAMVPAAQDGAHVITESILSLEILSKASEYSFINRIIKYLIASVSYNGNESLNLAILESAIDLLGSGAHNTTILLCLKLVSTLLKNEEVWASFAENMPEFITNYLSKYFVLSEVELSYAANDHVKFVNEVYKCGDDFDDLAASAGSILTDCAQRHPEIALECIDLVSSDSLDVGVFASLRMVSSITNKAVEKFPEEAAQFFESIINIIESEDELDRVAVLNLFASTPSYIPPLEIMNVIMQHVADDSILCVYNAVVAISGYLKSLSETPEAFREMLPIEPGDLIQLAIQLAEEFCHFDIAEGILHVVEYFGDELIGNAQEIAMEFISLMGKSQSEAALFTRQPIEAIIKIAASNMEYAANALPEIMKCGLEEAILIENPMVAGELIDALCICVMAPAEFIPSFWEEEESPGRLLLTDEYIRSSVEDIRCKSAKLIEALLCKDTDFTQRPYASEIASEIIQTVLDAASEDLEFGASICRAAAGVCLRAPPGGAIEALTPFALQVVCEAEDVGYVIALFDALVAADPHGVLDAAVQEGVFEEIMEIWDQFFNFNLSVMSVSAVVNAGIEYAISKYLEVAIRHTASRISGDLDEDDDLDDSIKWVSNEEALHSIFQLLAPIFAEEGELLQILDQTDHDSIESIAEYPQFREKYLSA